MSRRPIIAGNWKMNGTISEAVALTQALAKALNSPVDVEIVLCPPFTVLSKVGETLRESRILLGAQDTHWEWEGAFTGEISARMLTDLGCRYCIVGHSERRHLLGETDSMIHRKLMALLKAGLRPILCVGETLEQRKTRQTWKVVEAQLKAALEGIEPTQVGEEVVLAYEPVWAIGTGHNATPDQAQEVHAAIRNWLSAKMGGACAQSVRIQYGGSVKPENVGPILIQPDVDGALVGGASLDAKSFVSIVESAARAKGTRCSTG